MENKKLGIIILISIWMVLKAIWIYILQWLNSTIKQVDKNKYEVSYVIKGRTYKMIVKVSRGPRKVLLVYDENQTDITCLLYQYLGPEENFHGEIYTPAFFNKKQLVFEMSNGDEKSYSENDDIIF